jgi:RNA ligase (TIGR02306 family)
MSVFEAKIRKINRVEIHPAADKLELAVVGGYKAVVKKGEFKEGDLALYIPEDSVFTDLSVAEKLGVAAYLTGKAKNRVKAVRLRGVLSQGIVIPIKVVEYAIQVGQGKFDFCVCGEGHDLTGLLMLEKYEEPIPLQMKGKVRRWPSFLPHYDVENIKRPESMDAMVEGELVIFTEKLHGTNMTVAIGPGLEEGEEAFVCSRNIALKEDDINVYWRAVRQFDLINKLKRIAEHVTKEHGGVDSISLHGEVLGVQDLKYGLVNGEISFRAFDIRVNGVWADHWEMESWCNMVDIPTVPVLYQGPYSYDLLATIAEGQTTLAGGHMREGGVVRPIEEREDLVAGRVQFKFISEAYIDRKNGSELH